MVKKNLSGDKKQNYFFVWPNYYGVKYIFYNLNQRNGKKKTIWMTLSPNIREKRACLISVNDTNEFQILTKVHNKLVENIPNKAWSHIFSKKCFDCWPKTFNLLTKYKRFHTTFCVSHDHLKAGQHSVQVTHARL